MFEHGSSDFVSVQFHGFEFKLVIMNFMDHQRFGYEKNQEPIHFRIRLLFMGL